METTNDSTIHNVSIFTTLLVKLKMIDFYSFVSTNPLADEKLNIMSIELCEVTGEYWRHGAITQEQWQELEKLADIAHDDSTRQSDDFWRRNVAGILGVDTETPETPWRPRRSTTRKELVTMLRAIAQTDVPPVGNVKYYRFLGFTEGLEYMHIFTEEQRRELVLLAQRAAGFKTDPLPEGEALDNAVADIMAGRLPE